MLEAPLQLAGQGLIPPGSTTFHRLLVVHIVAAQTAWSPAPSRR
jgi:hypothetical protein